MKIAIFIDRWEPRRGGAERALAQLARAAIAARHEVHVFGLRADVDAPGTFHAVEVPDLPRGELERELAQRSAAAAKEAGCDVTLGIRHLEEVDVYWPHGGSHAATLAAGERSRGKVIGAVAGFFHRMSPRHDAFLAMEEQLLLRGGARTVWCVSTMVRDELATAYPECAPRLEVHANGVDLFRFRPGLRERFRAQLLDRLGLDPYRPVLLFLGGNWRLKGWTLLLRALSDLKELQWSCIAAGRDHDRAAAELRRGWLARRVRVIPHEDPEILFATADLLAQPTWRDPASLSTLEALACGIPVLTTTANGSAEAVRTGLTGAVVDTGDRGAFTDELAAWISRIGSDHPFVMRSREAARAAVEERSADAWLAGLLESLERVTS